MPTFQHQIKKRGGRQRMSKEEKQTFSSVHPPSQSWEVRRYGARVRSSKRMHFLPSSVQVVLLPTPFWRVAKAGLSQQKWRGWGEGPGGRKGQQEPPILILLWLEVGRKKT